MPCKSTFLTENKLSFSLCVFARGQNATSQRTQGSLPLWLYRLAGRAGVCSQDLFGQASIRGRLLRHMILLDSALQSPADALRPVKDVA